MTGSGPLERRSEPPRWLADLGATQHLGRGLNAEIWLVAPPTAGDAPSVTKVYRPGAEHLAARERRVLAALDGGAGLAPRVLSGRPGPDRAVWMEWRTGSSGLGAAGGSDWVTTLAHLSHRISRLPVTPALAACGAAPQAGLTPPDDLPTALRLAAHALSTEAPHGTTCVVHGDLHLGNVLWEGSEVVGVIDWAEAGIGVAEQDVSFTTLDLRLSEGPSVAERYLATVTALVAVDPAALRWWRLRRVLEAWADVPRRLTAYERAGITVGEDVLRARLVEEAGRALSHDVNEG